MSDRSINVTITALLLACAAGVIFIALVAVSSLAAPNAEPSTVQFIEQPK